MMAPPSREWSRRHDGLRPTLHRQSGTRELPSAITPPWSRRMLPQVRPKTLESWSSCNLQAWMSVDPAAPCCHSNELVRRAIEDSLSQPRKQTLHSLVLAVVAARPGVSAARIAHHADGACNADEVRRFAPVAACQAASVGAHREAASWERMKEGDSLRWLSPRSNRQNHPICRVGLPRFEAARWGSAIPWLTRPRRSFVGPTRHSSQLSGFLCR